ncbi:MAG: TraB/GumN family protein [Hyphomonadaceae bacterium]|nr:TraB/GumN family protein [Hyphomonadaceae bacterium]
MRAIVRRWAALLAAAALVACSPQTAARPQSGTGPALWRLADADSEVWLLGTVHVLPADLQWKSPAITAAFARADTIWFETPTDADAGARIAAIVARDGVNPPGVTLSSLLAPEDRDALRRVAGALDVPMAGLERVRPWLAALQLSLALMARQGRAAESGVEHVLEADAAAAGKARAYFETAEEQMAIFSTLSPAAQAQFLRATLRQIEEEARAPSSMETLWATGDVAGLTRVAQAQIDETGPETAEALVYARNARWAARIDAIMAGEGRAFVAVGAAHLVGPKGLPALLRAQGYVVEGP